MKLFEFLGKSPTVFHAVKTIEEILTEQGFTSLDEKDAWKLTKGKNYYVKRNDSSIIAFKVGKEMEELTFRAAASHGDSPSFKVKDKSTLTVKDKYVQLNTEGYGGMLCATWFDRPLSLAGRVIAREDGKLVSKLFNIDKDLLIIPSVAIHMNRKANEGFEYNKQVDMLPLIAEKTDDENPFMSVIAGELGLDKKEILSHEAYVYNRMKPSVWGANDEFISAGRLDDLQCAYASLEGFLKADCKDKLNIYACFDNEEVGSETRQGAGSSFFSDVLERVVNVLGYSVEDYHRALATGIMLSEDNAHSVHPNHPEKTDATNCVYMNGGIVVKQNANQKYATDAYGVAMCRDICLKENIPVQMFSNRSDMAGGSTLGNIATCKVPFRTVDIGLAMLAMHSAYETAGAKDTDYMARFTKAFYEY